MDNYDINVEKLEIGKFDWLAETRIVLIRIIVYITGIHWYFSEGQH